MLVDDVHPPARKVIFSLTLSEKGHPRATSVRMVGQALHGQKGGRGGGGRGGGGGGRDGHGFAMSCCSSILFISPGRWQRAEGVFYHAILEVWADW